MELIPLNETQPGLGHLPQHLDLHGSLKELLPSATGLTVLYWKPSWFGSEVSPKAHV
jgi:hypothetical protein